MTVKKKMRAYYFNCFTSDDGEGEDDRILLYKFKWLLTFFCGNPQLIIEAKCVGDLHCCDNTFQVMFCIDICIGTWRCIMFTCLNIFLDQCLC